LYPPLDFLLRVVEVLYVRLGVRQVFSGLLPPFLGEPLNNYLPPELHACKSLPFFCYKPLKLSRGFSPFYPRVPPTPISLSGTTFFLLQKTAAPPLSPPVSTTFLCFLCCHARCVPFAFLASHPTFLVNFAILRAISFFPSAVYIHQVLADRPSAMLCCFLAVPCTLEANFFFEHPLSGHKEQLDLSPL